MLVSFLFEIKDHRRKQGQQYQLGHILLFAILAIMSGADSYRKVHVFIETHYTTVDEVFDLNLEKDSNLYYHPLHYWRRLQS